jgi:hypothetical protein
MKYYIKNGKVYNNKEKVAVAISEGYGAGWTTWNPGLSPFDLEFNILFIKGKYKEVYDLAEKKGLFSDGIRNVIIKWIKPGTKFLIREYDGSEMIFPINELKIYTA